MNNAAGSQRKDDAVRIAPVPGLPPDRRMLCDLLIDTVANGGSAGFMHPLAPRAARAFWDQSLAAAARGERVVLGAWDGDVLVGTVMLLLNLPPNQPHRAEVAKLMTRADYNRRGVATALMRAIETLALAHGRTLLVLDTAVIGGAAGLYERLGYACSGEIPDYALLPQGGLTGTLIYWKRLDAPAAPDGATGPG